MEKYEKSDQTVASLNASNSKNYDNNNNNNKINNNNNNPFQIHQKESDETTTDRITKFFCDNATQISRIFEDDLLSPVPRPPAPVLPVVVQTDSFQQTQGPELNDSAIQTDEQQPPPPQQQQQEEEEDMLMVSLLPVPPPPPLKEMNDNEVQTDERISYPPSPPPSRSSPIPVTTNIIPDNDYHHSANNITVEDNNKIEAERRLEDSSSMRSTIVEVSSPPRKLYEKETKKNDGEEKKEEEEGETTIQSQILPQQQATNSTTIMQSEEMKISFMNFSVGDIALFVPIDEKRTTWMAFHSNRPYRFLAQVSLSHYLLSSFCFVNFLFFLYFSLLKESLEHFLAKDKKQQNSKERSRILGRIVFIDNAITTEEQNPYHLPVGVCYYVCYVEPLLVPKKKI
jgi:hypothetical protein